MVETSDGTSNVPATFDSGVSRFYVYILYSLRDKGLYIGFTSNLKVRLIEHAHNRATSTKNRTPLKLIFYEYFVSQKDAKARERYLKSGFGREQLKNILKRTFFVYIPK